MDTKPQRQKREVLENHLRPTISGIREKTSEEFYWSHGEKDTEDQTEQTIYTIVHTKPLTKEINVESQASTELKKTPTEKVQKSEAKDKDPEVLNVGKKQAEVKVETRSGKTADGVEVEKVSGEKSEDVEVENSSVEKIDSKQSVEKDKKDKKKEFRQMTL